MSKYDEVFGTRSRQKLYDEVFGKYTPPQEEPEKDSGLFDTAGNAFDWWKNNSLAGAGFLGGLASETAGNILQNLGLESAGNLAQNAADEMLDFGAKKVYTADADNFSGSFANQLMSGLTGSFGRLASMIHSDKTADTMIKSSDSLANKTPVSTDNLAEYFTNPRGFVSDAGQLAGSMAAIVPFMGLAPEAAAARGVAALGGDAITQALINRGLYGAAKVFAGGAPRAAQYALTSAPVEGAMEGGETRRSLLAQGASDEEATKESLITMGKNIPLLLATNTLEGLAFFSPLKGANKALQIAGRAAANSAQQQYEEFAQEGIQNAARGEPAGWLPWNGAPEQYEAAERVRYPALLMGGFGGAAQALGGRNENQENFERGSQENISNEDYSTRANKAGQNLWTWASNISGGQMSDGVFNSIVRNAQELGVDPKLALALATAESNGNQDDISPVGAIGVMQLMPETAEGLGVDPYDQEQNIRGGLTYLKQQLDRFNGDWDLAAAAYNAGAGAVEKYGGIPPYAETQGYVERINGFLGESPEYQGGEESLGNEGITYLGENGAGEGKYWVRNPNMNVSTEGMRPESLNALDILGKYYFDHTGKPLILNAGTNGDHAAGEFSHANGWKFDIIDQLEGDGALITADYGRGEFLNQFVKYGRSLGLGMNFEGEGTSNVHLDVAVDGTQWDGNGDHAGGFNLDRVRATAPKKSRSKQSPQEQTQQKNPQQEEPTKPLFDINAEDSTTQKLLEQFAKERFSKAIDDEDGEPVNFFNGMFDDKDNFQNTPENRNAIVERYGDEFKIWAANQNQNQQEQPQPVKTNSDVKQADDPYQKRAEIKNTANKFLEQLRATGDPSKAPVAFGLQNALTGGNFAEAENILKQNGVTLPQPQTQPQTQPSQDPVTQNTTPENILSQPKQKSSPLERKIKVASAQVKLGPAGKSSRKKQGAALIDLAAQNGIEIPNSEVTALTIGSTKAVQKWRDNLMQAGAFKMAAPQTQQQTTQPVQEKPLSLKERARRILAVKHGEPVKQRYKLFRAVRQLGENITYDEPQGNATGKGYNENPDDLIANNIAQRIKDNEAARTRKLDDTYTNEQSEVGVAQGKSNITNPDDLIANIFKNFTKQNQEQSNKTAQPKSQLQPQPQPQPQTQPVQPSQDLVGKNPDNQEDNYTIDLAKAAFDYYDSLDLKNNADLHVADKLMKALDKENFAEVENILKQNGVAIPQSQSQSQPQTQAQQEPTQVTAPESTQSVQSKKNYGNTAEVITGSRKSHQVQYRVVEASELNSSHVIGNGNVFANKNYPAEFQPRDRQRADMQAQLISMANNLNPADLLNARDVNQGAPVIRNDGVVLNGNGRTAAIRYAYENGKGEAYKNALVENAERLGLNANAISKMNQPVLVRELQNDLSEGDVRDITSTQTGGVSMGASEQSRIDAQKLSADTLALFPQSDSVDLTHASATDFLRAAVNEIATPDQRNALTTDEGAISQDGINRVKRAIFAKAYGDEGLIARMSESTDDNVRGVTNAFLSAAPLIAKVKAGMQNGTLHNYDLSAINDAAKKLSALRDEGKPVSKYLQEQSLFGEDSAETKEMLSLFDRYKRSPKKIAATLKKIAGNIQEQGNPNQIGLFGESEPAPLINLIKRARQEVENEGQGTPLFSRKGEVDTRIENFVDDKNLTPQQKLHKSFGEKLGVKTVFFRNEDGDFHGAHASGTTYINVNSNKPLGKVFWHESLHWLKKNNADLYGELAKAADINDEQRDAYLERSERTDLYTDEAIDEEIIADQMEDVAKRTGLLQNIAGKNLGLIQRVVQWLKDTMNKFIAHFRNPDGKLTTEQSIALADEFGRIAKDLVDPNGQKIFRYNRRTHNIELADGRSLDTVQNDEDTRYSFAGRKAKTADKESLKRAKQMEKSGANRDEIYNATGWFKGKDNKWRFEIPDNFDKIDFDKLLKNNENFSSLDKIYDNSALFAAYPQLRKVLVRSKQLKSPESYGYTNGTEITLNRSKINDEREEAGKTLVHEIQHVIQDYEKFSGGGSDSNVLTTLKNNMAMIKDTVKAIPNGKKSLKPLSEAFSAARFAREMGEDEAELLQDAEDTIKIIKKGFSPTNWQKIKYLAERHSELSDAIDGIRDAKGEYIIVDHEDGSETEEPLQPRLKYEAYERLGGEQEARAVGERLFNRNGTPKPHDEDALIIFGGNTYGMIKQSENKKRPSINGDGELVKDGAMREIFPPSAVTADGTTKRQSPAKLKVTRDNKGGVGTSGNSVDTNSPNGSISQGEEPVKYSLGGKKAKTADKSLLRRAMEMERRGANRDQIFQTTGWVKGKDNLWRFEIPDDLTKINFGKLKRDGEATLDEVYHNPKLFAAYPQLKNMRIAISVLPKINGNLQAGEFWVSKNIITLNKELVDARPERAKKTLVHEIQHAIQKIEGFTFGGDFTKQTSASDYKNLGGEQEAREVAARADMSEEKRRATTPTIHDENAVITSADKKRTAQPDIKQNEPSNDESNHTIGNNDNSSESLTRKIKNKLSAYLDGKRPTERRKKRITENLRALSGHRILYGHVKGADDIVVDHMQKLIQSRNTYDWEKLLPVVGKEIAKQLKLNPTSEQSNYIADWLLTGALNNTSAEAKNFQKAMRDNPAQAELLQQTRDLFQEISDMTPWERVGSSLVQRKGKTFLEKLGIGEGSFEEQFVNDLAGLTKLVDDAAKNSTPEVAEMIRRGCSPDKLAQLSRGKGAVAELMVKSKTHDIENVRAELSEIYPAIDFSRFKPLEAIFESVGGDVKGLEIFAVAKLTKEICEYNRANPDDKITPYISEADADHIISTGEKKFGQAQKDLVAFSNTLLGMQYDSGLLTDNQFFSILKKWKNYIPMARVFDENENYDKLDFLKKRKGHENDTWSPIQTMIANANKVVQACEQNKVKLEIANLVRFGGFDSNLSEVTSSNPDVGNIIRFKENGKTKYLETPDPAIKRAVDALQSQSEGAWLVKMLRAATSFMRTRYTGGNVDFAAGNLARDLPDAYVHNQHLGLTTPITELIDAWRIGFKGAWRAFTGKPLTKEFIEWQIHGGAQAAFVSGDVDYIQRSINDATTTRAQRYRKNFFSQLLDDFQKISEFTENITRLSTYTLAKKQLAKRNGGIASLSDKQLAAHASREASIDFAKAGISTRKINNYILFANAAVQGLAQWGYAVREAKRGNSKPLFGKVFRAMTHAVCLAMLQFALAHGDDERKKEYKYAPAWEKETYWILGGVRIPKGMDVGIRLMANFTDEALGALFDKKSFDVQRLGDTLKNALPSITATIFTPALEVKMNHSIFRDAPIVPRSKENLNPEHQFDTNTSSVAKLFGQMTGWSPLKIDYLIQGYLGTMGRFAAHVPNYVERGGIGLDEMPMIRRFVFEPYKNPQIVKDYYEAYDEQFSHYNTYKLTREKPDGFDPALYKRLQAAQEPMRKISKLEQRILDDPKLSYDERRAKIRELEKRRIALCEKVFRRAQ